MDTSLYNHSIRQAFLWIILFIVFTATRSAQAQGIERQSLAGEGAVAGLRASDENQPYNLRIGPITLRTSASVDGSFNDNITISKHGRESDFIISPSLGLQAQWQITDLNTLTFNLGIGYNLYTVHSGDSSLVIAPDSALEMNFFLGDFKISPFDRFSYQDDPIDVGVLSNTNNFDRFTNDAGAVVTYDLGDLVFSLGYDHQNFWVFGSQYNYLDYSSDSVTPQFSYKVTQTINAGISSLFSSMSYDENIQNNSTTVSVGPFVNAQITDNVSAKAQVGFIDSDYGHAGLNGDRSDLEGYYFSVGVSQRINDVLTQSLTGGHEYIPGITSNYTERFYANYSPVWQATTALSVAGNLWWENLNDSEATFRQNANRYGAGFTLGYALAEHNSLSLSYQFVLKDATPSFLSYYQNLLTLGYRYQF